MTLDDLRSRLASFSPVQIEFVSWVVDLCRIRLWRTYRNRELG